jgi:hypothetical protein
LKAGSGMAGMVKSSVWNQFRTKSPIVKLPLKMTTPRKLLIILMGSLGAGLFLYGLVVWFETGCDFNNLWFSKNTFGTHPLHMSVLGLFTMGYSAIDFCFAIFSRRS